MPNTIYEIIFKKSYKNNKFRIPAPTWNEEFKLPGGSYSISDYFEYILKNMEKGLTIPFIIIYVNKTENRIRIESGYYIELLMPETKKLLGSSKSKITKDKNGENVPHLEVTEVVIHKIISKSLYTFVPNNSFGHLLDTSPTNFHIFKNL